MKRKRQKTCTIEHLIDNNNWLFSLNYFNNIYYEAKIYAYRNNFEQGELLGKVNVFLFFLC